MYAIYIFFDLYKTKDFYIKENSDVTKSEIEMINCSAPEFEQKIPILEFLFRTFHDLSRNVS